MFGALPAEAQDFQRFEAFDVNVRCEAEVIDAIDTRSLRYSLPDTFNPGRQWLAKKTSLIDGQAAIFACRLSLSSQNGDYGFGWSVPDCLAAVCQNNALATLGQQLNSTPGRWWNTILYSGVATNPHIAGLQAQLAALEQLVKTERRNTEEAIELAVQADEERQCAQETLAQEQALTHSLQAHIANLTAQLQRGGGAAPTPAPTTYAQIPDWASTALSSKLRRLPRAEKGLRNARYEKPADVVAGLQLLAGLTARW